MSDAALLDRVKKAIEDGFDEVAKNRFEGVCGNIAGDITLDIAAAELMLGLQKVKAFRIRALAVAEKVFGP